jgi:hypothetical protein
MRRSRDRRGWTNLGRRRSKRRGSQGEEKQILRVNQRMMMKRRRLTLKLIPRWLKSSN